jgi:hypothetical protein
MAHYGEKSRKLANSLDVPEFNPPCPLGLGLSFTAGQCGRFRNPDLAEPPPKITIRRGIPYYRRGEPHNIMWSIAIARDDLHRPANNEKTLEPTHMRNSPSARQIKSEHRCGALADRLQQIL